MKIGILSMQQITNYGSFLQAYALKSMIGELGHDVEFINIERGQQLPEYKISPLHKVRLLLNRLKVKHPLRQLKYTLNLHKRFDLEFKPELGVKSEGYEKPHFDVVVIGSDEVFNVAQTTWFGFSPQLFGEGLNAGKVISYAGSFGATTHKILQQLKLDKRIGQMMSAMQSISVRDANSAEIVKKITSRDPVLNVDPVVAYNFDREIVEPRVADDYMLVYTYPGRMNAPEEVQAITAYARRNGLKIIAVANYFDWVDTVVTPHPFEVLGYFKHARCIVTDTFHGAVMSLKYNKPFAVIVRGMNSNKLTFLLKQFMLDDRIAASAGEVGRILDSKIDYRPVNEIIDREQSRTMQYLGQQLC